MKLAVVLRPNRSCSSGMTPKTPAPPLGGSTATKPTPPASTPPKRPRQPSSRNPYSYCDARWASKPSIALATIASTWAGSMPSRSPMCTLQISERMLFSKSS